MCTRFVSWAFFGSHVRVWCSGTLWVDFLPNFGLEETKSMLVGHKQECQVLARLLSVTLSSLNALPMYQIEWTEEIVKSRAFAVFCCWNALIQLTWPQPPTSLTFLFIKLNGQKRNLGSFVPPDLPMVRRFWLYLLQRQVCSRPTIFFGFLVFYISRVSLLVFFESQIAREHVAKQYKMSEVIITDKQTYGRTGRYEFYATVRRAWTRIRSGLGCQPRVCMI